MRIEFRFTTLGFSGIGFTGYRRARRRIPAISVAAITVCAASSAFAQAVSPTITDQYSLNFYDYRQPDPLMGTTAVTLAQGVGGGFLPAPFPSTWGATPTFAQAQAFGNATTITAQQNGVSLGNLLYENFPGAPWEHSKEIGCSLATLCPPNLRGQWNLTLSNPGFVSPSIPAGSVGPGNPPATIPAETVPAYPTANIKTYAIPADIPQEIPFVRNVQLSNSTPNAVLSWTNPTFAIPSDAALKTVLLVTDVATKQVQDDFVLSAGQTSFNLALLGSIPDSDGVPTQPLVPGKGYQFSVQATLVNPDPDVFELYSTPRSFTNFYPTNGAIVPGPVYLPTVSLFAGHAVYNFDMDVTAGQSYNIDPATAKGFIYEIGAGDPNFASVDLPNIDNPNPYELLLWDGSKFVFDTFLSPNTIFDFAAGGVGEFEVLGIDTNLNLLNGNEFVTTVTFEGSGSFTGTMTSVPVPEPSTWAMLLVGFVGIGFAGFRRKEARSVAA